MIHQKVIKYSFFIAQNSFSGISEQGRLINIKREKIFHKGISRFTLFWDHDKKDSNMNFENLKKGIGSVHDIPQKNLANTLTYPYLAAY